MAEGNHYFPPDSIKWEYLKPSDTRTVCPWKGTASYKDVEVSGERNANAVWYLPRTKSRRQGNQGRCGFLEWSASGSLACPWYSFSPDAEKAKENCEEKGRGRPRGRESYVSEGFGPR